MRFFALLALSSLFACGARTGPDGLPSPAPEDTGGTDARDAVVLTDLVIPDVADVIARDVAPPRPTDIILFDRCDGAEQVVARFDPDTGARERLFTVRENYEVGPNGLAVSLDGRRFAWSAYERIAGNPGWRIYVQDGIGGTPTRLTWAGMRPSDSPENPAWSPDGTQIAFSVMQQSGAYTIGVAPSAMGSAMLLMGGGRELRSPTFSADGAWIAAVSATNMGGPNVFVSRTPAPGRMFTPIAPYYYPGAAAFTQNGMLVSVGEPRNGPEITVRPVPSNSEIDHIPLPAETRVWAIAAEPNGDRVVLHVLPSQLVIVDLRTHALHVLYDPPGCTLVHNGLSWVYRAPR